MIQHVVILLVASYFVFCLTSNKLNPIKFKDSPFKKRKFQLGRAMALVSLASGSVALLLHHSLGFNDRLAVFAYLALGLLLSIPSLLKYRSRSVWR